MRLINLHTFQLEDFVSPEHTPRYAILSHTWGSDEVTYQDFITGAEAVLHRRSGGWRKVHSFRKAALEHGSNLAYGWVDTCCIDKTSSAELSEAINSMMSW